MYLAEIHGKLSTENENREDILTSNVFSFLKYADRSLFLRQFLALLGLKVSIDDVLHTEFRFWPSFTDGTQPDLLIITGPYYLLIEAKYHSGFGKATPIKKHQLVREIEGGAFEAATLDKKFKILIVTADYYFKPEIYKDIPSHHSDDLIWINWQKIAFLIFGILDQNPVISLETKLFAEDLYRLLLKKNLRNFEGGKVLSQVSNLKNFRDNIFFQAITARYRGDFLGFLPVMEAFPGISPPEITLFFEPKRRFFQFPGVLFDMVALPEENLFLKGGNQHE